MGIVANRGDRKMNLVRMRQRAGSNRVEPDREFAENSRKSVRRYPVRREVDQGVHDFPPFDVFLELVFRIVRKQRFEFGGAGDGRELLQDGFGKSGDIEILAKSVRQKFLSGSFHLHLLGAGQLRGIDHIPDHLRAVFRLDREGVTRLIDKTAACE